MTARKTDAQKAAEAAAKAELEAAAAAEARVADEARAAAAGEPPATYTDGTVGAAIDGTSVPGSPVGGNITEPTGGTTLEDAAYQAAFAAGAAAAAAQTAPGGPSLNRTEDVLAELAGNTPRDDDGLPPAVFLIHPTRGHVVHVTAARAAADGMLTWAEATPAQIKAAGLAG